MNEEIQKDEGSVELQNSTNSIPSNPYINLNRQLNEADLETPAVQRILLGEVDKLENQNFDLVDIVKVKDKKIDELRDKHHQIDRDFAVLEEKVKTSKSQEILYSFCLTSGSIIIGFSKSVWETGYGILFVIVGFLLIIGAIISKAIRWN